MKSTWILAILMLTALPGVGAEKECVVVRLRGSIEVPHKTLMAAELLNVELFNAIGVAMQWKDAGRPSADPKCAEIVLEFTSSSPEHSRPGALAYASPYQSSGTRIRVFTDRLLRGQRTGTQAEALLGYVMAHEIGHILQGVSRHSEDGVMKAHTPTASTLTAKLHFSHQDVSLIHDGLARLVRSGNPDR